MGPLMGLVLIFLASAGVVVYDRWTWRKEKEKHMSRADHLRRLK
jgi:hypothetical protein